MIKITVKYDNLDDEEVTRDLYFHMSMRQLTELEVGSNGGLYARLLALVQSENKGQMLQLFEEIVGLAYGERQDNNPDDFLKNKAVTERFLSSLAYDALFSKLVSDETEMINFINGLVPKELMAQVEAQGGADAVLAKAGNVELPAEDTGPKLLTDEELKAATGLSYPKDSKDNVVPWAYREPTDSEVRRMSRVQLLDITQRKSKGWVPKS
jgi:hypothetical protein